MGKQRKISIGVGVIIVRDTRLLVTRRRKGSSWGEGSVAMPGGHIEEKERAVDCAVRECLEEVGVVVQPQLIDGHTHVVHAEEWFRQGKHHWTVYIHALIQSGEPANLEPHKHADWWWASLEELGGLCGPDDWIPLAALRANRGKIGL